MQQAIIDAINAVEGISARAGIDNAAPGKVFVMPEGVEYTPSGIMYSYTFQLCLCTVGSSNKALEAAIRKYSPLWQTAMDNIDFVVERMVVDFLHVEYQSLEGQYWVLGGVLSER